MKNISILYYILSMLGPFQAVLLFFIKKTSLYTTLKIAIIPIVVPALLYLINSFLSFSFYPNLGLIELLFYLGLYIYITGVWTYSIVNK